VKGPAPGAGKASLLVSAMEGGERNPDLT